MNSDTLYPEDPVFLLDDEPAWLHSLSLSLKVSAGINHILTCHDSRNTLDLLGKNRCSLVLLDLTMPHVGGEDLLVQIKKEYPNLPIIIISGMNQMETAIRCIKAGADDFYVKTDERERVIAGIVRALKQRQLKQENQRLVDTLMYPRRIENPAFSEIITDDIEMYRIFSYLQAISGSSSPVLISGESGTGKELIAKALHHLGGTDKPWVAVNVAGLDEMVFSDSLFGHEKGAYTGAERQRSGMVEAAADGILFLDEIGDLSTSLQVKLLRLLQEREYYSLGGDRPKKVRCRILVASNQDLQKKVATGSFRQDLFYRLATHRVELPPLRKRKKDIPLLLDKFLSMAADDLGKKKPNIPQALVSLLSTYHFPGNIRELQSMSFDVMSVYSGGILPMAGFWQKIEESEQHKDSDSTVAGSVAFGENLPTLKETSHLLVDEAMKRARGNQSVAARMIGVTPQALSKRLKQR